MDDTKDHNLSEKKKKVAEEHIYIYIYIHTKFHSHKK